MKKTIYILLATLACLLFAFPATAQYASAEFYPNADPFFCAGTQNNHWKIDAWSTPASEISFTAGPVIKGVRVGIGAGMLAPNGEQKLGYINADLGFTLNVNDFTWSSYNCNQVGQNGVSDFILARQWISYRGWPVGIIGHNRQCGEDPWEYYWGAYYDFGQIGALSTNKLCLTFNLHPTDDTGKVWAAWIIDL